ncbi:MAG: SurA N-terminal domain-containing protein [Bacteroidetes bacterium]|nr:SurA N-terminal domain-containing protein [Bacteroidota bacterium]
MAVIGKIRKHSALLVIVIGVALAAFVLGDFTKKSRPSNYVGKIAGEDITITDFNRKYEENVEASKRQAQSDRIPQEELYRIRENTWNQLVQEVVMGKEYDKLGIVVTPEELFDQIQGPKPHFAVIQNFVNPETGQYDRDMVIRYLQNLDNMPQENKDQWLTFERYVKEDRLKTKYSNLVTKSYYIPMAFAKKTYEEKNDKASAQLVGVRYSSVPDSLMKLTDKDYDRYFEDNKIIYDQPESRDIEYIVFDIVPSEKDMQSAEAYVKTLVDEFKLTENVVGFVNANSDTKYDSTWFSKSDVPVALESVMFDAEKGTVYGPYFENGAYHLARLVDITMRPDSMKASHVLISYKGAARSQESRTKEEAAKLADSLFTIIKKNPSQMGALAAAFSTDPSASKNQGDLGWFKDGQMVGPFNNFVYENKIGTIGFVETMFGYHVVEVTGKKEPAKKIRIAQITHTVTASTQTFQETFAKASKFATENKTHDRFIASIESQGLNKKIANSLRPNTFSVAGIENPRQIVRWAFDENTKVNDVSTIFDLDNMYVIASLTRIIEKGIPEIGLVKEIIHPQVVNMKKGEYLTEKMKAYANDLNQLATAFGVEVSDVPSITFDTRSLPGFGQEQKAIGELFALRPAGMTKPIAGNTSAFVIKMNELTKAGERGNYDPIRNELKATFEQQVRNNSPFKAIEKVSDIEDNRIIYF